MTVWNVKVPATERKPKVIVTDIRKGIYQFRDCECPKCHIRHTEILNLKTLDTVIKNESGLTVIECKKCIGGK